MKGSGSESSTERNAPGAKVPGSEMAPERKFQGTKGPGSESSRERNGPGAKVPGNERALERKFQGANWPESYWNFRSRERIGPGAKRPGTLTLTLTLTKLDPKPNPKLSVTSTDNLLIMCVHFTHVLDIHTSAFYHRLSKWRQVPLMYILYSYCIGL